MKKKVFISYSYEDKKFVEWLKDNLQDLGVEIWYDKQEIQLGDSIKEKISSWGEPLLVYNQLSNTTI